MSQPDIPDYSLTGTNAALAIERGLAEADWYTTSVPKDKMRGLLQLRPGDALSAVGPFGDFHIRPSQREMIYIGGGSGMAPLRSHITHLFETQKTARKVSFWYGARSRQELFYQDHFESIAGRFPNFSYHAALSSPLDTDKWQGLTGFIHEVVFQEYLKTHTHPQAIEFYLCGPPQMMHACQKMLHGLGVADSQITYDEF